MNGITYFKLESPYLGDKTKNCALSAAEMDNNFYVLEGRDIKKLDVVNNDIVIELMNGEKLAVKGVFDKYIDELGFDYDPKAGVLTISKNGEVQQIFGFVTKDDFRTDVMSDETIIGNGSSKAPIGIAPTAKTGQYKPVIRFIDTCDCNCKHKVLPKMPKVGDRYLTKEISNDYGYLYPFAGIKKLRCDLQEAGYEWDIPTKDDWDNMLNAIEPMPTYRNHNDVTTHRYLGKVAGKLLKSAYDWCDEEPRKCNCHDDECCDKCKEPNMACFEEYHRNDDDCFDSTTSEFGRPKICDVKNPNSGVDAFAFTALPAGMADEDNKYMYFKERAYFWTRTNSGYSAFVKRFDYDSSKVYQDILDLDCYASVRLVKKWTGGEFRGTEEIFGETYPAVLIPSLDGGHMVWTAINLRLNNCKYKSMRIPVDSIENVTRYYINEWNGKCWVKNLLKEGESVVIVDSPNGRKDYEYRIVDGVLTSVSDELFNEIMENVEREFERVDTEIEEINRTLEDHQEQINQVSERLDSEIERAVAEEQRISAALEQETQDRIEIDNQQWNAINNEILAREEGDNRISAALEQETQDRIEIDNQQWNAINEEIQNRIDAVNQVSAALEQETQDRIEVDNQQWNAISTEILAREEGDNRISAALEQETNDRIAEDNHISAALEQETQDRIAEDNRISAALEQETQDRIEVDNQQWDVINNEIQRAIERENEIESQIPDTTTTYNSADGKLTFRRGDEELFVVQMDYNFGEF